MGVTRLVVYLDLVIALNFIVDLLLLMGTSRLSGYPLRLWRGIAAAALGSVYAAACMSRAFIFLSAPMWGVAVLAVMCFVAFGWDRSALRRGALFLLLSMALGGIASSMNGRSFWMLLLSAAGLVGICFIGFQGHAGVARYVSVRVRQGNKVRSFLALQDTGNCLKDPVTGRSVLIVGADLAWELMGLTRNQLLDPVGTLESALIPGLRLIPYRSVGQSNGMLLCMKFDEIQIDGAAVDTLVAFAPDNIGGNEGFEALTGGAL